MSLNLFFLLVKKKKELKEKNQYVIKNSKNYKLFQKFDFLVKLVINVLFGYKNNFLNIKKNNKNYIYSMKNCKIKTTNSSILKHFFKTIMTMLKITKKVPTILSFFNAKQNYQWFVKKLSNHLFIPIVRFFKKISYNGCRKKKLKRKS